MHMYHSNLMSNVTRSLRLLCMKFIIPQLGIISGRVSIFYFHHLHYVIANFFFFFLFFPKDYKQFNQFDFNMVFFFSPTKTRFYVVLLLLRFQYGILFILFYFLYIIGLIFVLIVSSIVDLANFCSLFQAL